MNVDVRTAAEVAVRTTLQATPKTSGFQSVVLTLLDRARRALYRTAVPWLSPLLADRDRRVLVFGVVGVTLSLVLCLACPLYLLALGPVLLGVPHVLSDVRYLLVQPGYHRRVALWLSVAPLVVWAGTGGGVAVGLAATAVAFAVTPGRVSVRALGFSLAALGAIATYKSGRVADVVFAHLHNVIAVVWFAALARSRAAWLVAASFAVGCAAVLVLPLSWLSTLSGPTPHGMSWHAQVLAPGVEGALAARLVALFAFAQSVHYAVWIRLVPEVQRRRPAPRSYRATFVALRDDVGSWLLAAFAVLAVAVLAYAAWDLMVARDRYLHLALFHGHMELALGAVWLTHRRFPGRRG